MNRPRTRNGLVGLLGAWALALGSPGGADAVTLATNTGNKTGIVASPVVVTPVEDPWDYLIPLEFKPDTLLGEYFKTGNYFTISNFGSLIGLKGLDLTDTDFSLSNASKGDTMLRFDYTGPNLVGNQPIGSITIDTDTLSPDIVITYYDQNNLGSFIGENDAPVTLVPEPASIALLGLGAAAALYQRRRLARRPA